MQACIGIKQSHLQEIGAYLGLLYLETMMTHILSGPKSGFQEVGCPHSIAPRRIHLTLVCMNLSFTFINTEFKSKAINIHVLHCNHRHSALMLHYKKKVKL